MPFAPLIGQMSPRKKAAVVGGASQIVAWDAAANTAAGISSYVNLSTTNVANDTIQANGASPDGTLCAILTYSINNGGALAKSYWEYKIIQRNAGMNAGFAATANHVYAGNGGFSAGMWDSGGYTDGHGSGDQGLLGIDTGHVLCMAYNKAVKKMWFREDAGNWYGAGDGVAGDPATGSGGWFYDYGVNTIFPALSLFDGSDKVQVLGGTNITQAVPSGFTVIP